MTLEELQRLAESTTPGPWKTEPRRGGGAVYAQSPDGQWRQVFLATGQAAMYEPESRGTVDQIQQRNAEFVTAAKAALSPTGCVTLMAAERDQFIADIASLQRVSEQQTLWLHKAAERERRFEGDFERLRAELAEAKVMIECKNVALKTACEALDEDMVVHRTVWPDGRVETVVQSEQATQLRELREAATELIEHREEASKGVWYVSGTRGHKLLEALGIAYVEKP